MTSSTSNGRSALLVVVGGVISVASCTSDDGGSARTDGGGTGGVVGATGGSPGTGGAQNATGGATPGSGGAGGSTPGSGGSGGAGDGGSPATGGSGGGAPVLGCRAPEPSTNPGNPCHGEPPPPLRLATVVSGLNAPLFITQAPGDDELFFVVEQAGRIERVRNGQIEDDPLLDISSIVSYPGPVGEMGLLGMALDPNYAETGRFWVNYSSGTFGTTNIVEYRGTPGEPADPNSAKPLLTVQQTQFLGNHKGGMLAFGPDGCLFIGMGDGGGGNDPDGTGQNRGDQLGNMLRVDVDAYPTPAPGNMTGNGVDPHSWSYGFRNPFRFSFDRQTGDLYIADVGQDAVEEVNVEPRGVGGRNYGWNIMEGGQCRGGGTSCNMSGLTLPVAEQSTQTHLAVIGGYVYRGSIPGMAGRYIYGGYRSRDIWSFTYEGETNGVGRICDEYDLDDLNPAADITSFGQDNAGEIYVVTASGVIYRIEAE